MSYGILCFNMKYFDEAESTFKKLIKTASGSTNRLFYETSKEGVTNVITTQGNVKGMYYYYLGQIEYARANYPSAIAYYDTAISLQPDKTE